MTSKLRAKMFLAIYLSVLLADLYGFFIGSGALVFAACACLAALILSSLIYNNSALRRNLAMTIQSSGYLGEKGDNHKSTE